MPDGTVVEIPTKQKHPGGRPTKYQPEMCQAIIEMGRVGASKAEMAYDLGISMSTFDLWQNNNSEFSEAVKEAVQLSQGWWEQQGRLKTFDDKGFNATSYIFQMKNRFREDWNDRTVNEQHIKVTVSFEERLRSSINRTKAVDAITVES